MSQLWLRQSDRTLISQVLNPHASSPCSFERSKPGRAEVKIVHDVVLEPCVADLIHNTPPSPGRAFKTWFDTGIELAWFRGDPVLTAETIPEVDPTWAGPIWSVGLDVEGFLTVRAWTQEAYVTRSTVGDTLINYLATGGLSDYRFSDDPSLDSWEDRGTSTESTTTSGPMWLDDTRSALVEAGGDREGIAAVALVPDSAGGNYATATVAVLVPTGTALWAVYGADDAQIVGAVELYVDGTLIDTWDFELPDGWEFDVFYPVSVQVRQPAGPDVSYTFVLYGGNGGPIRFGRPMFTRPANVGAPAGQDISDVPEAIADEVVDLVQAITSYDVTEIGIDLAESFRYFLVDHEDYSSVLGDWSGFGEWWVSEGVIYWAPERGELIEEVTLSTAEDLSGWGIEVDASAASNRLYGQVRPEGGASYEVAVGSGSPNRLVAVEQVPTGMGPGDAPEWCNAALAQKVPVVTLTGIPAKYTGLPGDDLASYMPGNWMAVEVVPLGLTGEDALLPTVDSVTWDPVTDQVVPKWVLGGKARQDPLALITAQLLAAQRAARVYRPLPTKTFRRYAPPIQTWSTGEDRAIEVEVGEGWHTATVHGVVGGGTFTAGSLLVAVSGTLTGGTGTQNTLVGSSEVASTTSMTFRGPQTITGLTGAPGAAGGSGITSQALTLTIQRFA